MFVKICGITNLEDAQAAIDSGARALGFIFHPESPRHIEPEVLADWIDAVPADVWRVGVFVNREKSEVETICRKLKLHVAQLHGAESTADIPSTLRVWKAFRIEDHLPSEWDGYPVEAVMMDGTASGRHFDWRIARNIGKPVILAGGLNEVNVARAIDQAQPWGVDACSSLEAYPGKKDHARMARFLQACHQTFSNLN